MDDYTDSPIPEGFRRKLLGEADLEGAFDVLQGSEHFFCETMRGRIRSLQLRFEEAWEHLAAAVEMSAEAEETIPNLVRCFLLEIYRFDNALVESRVPASSEIPLAPLPEIPPEIFELYPEVKLVLDLRNDSEARYLLHLGRCEEAAAIYTELIDQNPGKALSMYYINLAACQYGQGLEGEALRNLENAGFATASMSMDPSDPERVNEKGDCLNAALHAATLSAFYSFLEKDDEASDWHLFLQKLDIPEETKDLFEQRATRLLDRCLDHSRLVAF